MPAKPLPDPAYLRQRLRYEPETGKLFWREAKWWLVGRPAFTSAKGNGYLMGALDGRFMLAHRVAWAIHHGAWPSGQIDHSNHIRDDNRIVNLRVTNNLGNCQNLPKRRGNTSGATGVHWDKPTGKWRALIMVNGRIIHLGRFANLDDAAAARKAAESEHGFHANHGS